MKNDFEATGQLIADIGGTAFATSLSGALQEIAPFDYTVVFGYFGYLLLRGIFDRSVKSLLIGVFGGAQYL